MCNDNKWWWCNDKLDNNESIDHSLKQKLKHYSSLKLRIFGTEWLETFLYVLIKYESLSSILLWEFCYDWEKNINYIFWEGFKQTDSSEHNIVCYYISGLAFTSNEEFNIFRMGVHELHRIDGSMAVWITSHIIIPSVYRQSE